MLFCTFVVRFFVDPQGGISVSEFFIGNTIGSSFQTFAQSWSTTAIGGPPVIKDIVTYEV